MYQRFTDRALKVMQLAEQESRRLNYEYVGPEHILLGLVKEGSGVAANVLKNLDVRLGKIQLELEKLVPPGPALVSLGELPLSLSAKQLIERAKEESREMNHDYNGSEHLLLGLLHEESGAAAQVLADLGVTLEETRDEIVRLLGHGIDQS